METQFEWNAKIFKALSDPKRLRIIEMLSCGELCACKILEKFQITQPTLSHDMKLLCDAGLLKARRDGKWMYYSLNEENVQIFKQFICRITSDTPDCICKRCSLKNNN
ncbi:MAG: transcriptional regulator, ArsR family [Caproiciproducens sp.]|nr:transcriptional regulator, ArsR family [Caproiciproducens sp.]